MAAVLRGDEPGAQGFKDDLLLWAYKFDELFNYYYYHHKADEDDDDDWSDADAGVSIHPNWLLTTRTFDRHWIEVRSSLRPLIQGEADRATPRDVFRSALVAAQQDVATIAGARCLLWHSTARRAPEMVGRLAVMLLRDERRRPALGPDETTPGSARGAFDAALALLLRAAVLSPQTFVTRSELDDFVLDLDFSVRIRTIQGRDDLGADARSIEALEPTLLAIMAANLGSRRLWRFSLARVSELAEAGGPLARFEDLEALRRSVDRLGADLDRDVDPAFERAVQAFDPELDVSSRRAELKEFLGLVSRALYDAATARMRSAALDPIQMARLRSRLAKAMVEEGPNVGLFTGYDRGEGAASQPRQVVPSARFDKGAFLNPHLSRLSVEESETRIAEAFRNALAREVWQDLCVRPRREIEIEVEVEGDGGRERFWRAVVDQAAAVGERPTVVVPPSLTHGLHFLDWRNPGPKLTGFDLEYGDADELRGSGAFSFVRLINGVRVFVGQEDDPALLFSGAALLRVEYGAATPARGLVDVAFVDEDAPKDSRLTLAFAQTTTWSNAPVIGFRIKAGMNT
jgi:hypothetical protein